jgi:hypothetical protein
MGLKWVFAKTDGGLERGPNDAGVHTFKGGVYDSLAREIIQNSCDAQYDESRPVRVSFSLENVGLSHIPDSDGLRAAISRCISYWGHDSRATDDLWEAHKALDGPTVQCLKISDYNTKGLTGADNDRTGNWYLLIRCAGSSAKSSGAGGSFGIGKGAPFAASVARTVFYSTRTATSDVAFQGVTLLASHTDDRGTLSQANGFLNDPSGNGIRDIASIPRLFQRSEPGTDIWVVGCVEAANWKNELTQSVLDFFWPAIAFGNLEVTIGAESINRHNLDELLNRFSGSEQFTAKAYYDAFTKSTPIVSELTEIGKCSLYLAIQDDTAQKKVAMIRKTGMVIERRIFRSPVPFTGVFVCRNDIGNEKLSRMEPPKHDKWDPNHPTEKANTKIFSAITTFIRAELKKLNPVDLSKQITIRGTERFLPDQDDQDLGSWDGGKSESESFSSNGAAVPAVVRIAVKKQKTSIEPAAAASEPDPLIGPPLDEDELPDSPSPRPTPQHHDDETAKPDPSGSPHRAVAITYRTYAADLASGRYVASIHPAETTSAMIRLFAVGEDMRADEKPTSAMTPDGKLLPILQDGSIGPVQLQKGTEFRLELQSTSRERFALEVAAHEAP